MTESDHDAGSAREFLRIALPLAASTGTMSIMMVTDRTFLTRYSIDALAASLPAGLLSWTMMSLAFGTVAYINVFVAQYHGAGRSDRIGLAIWQGVFISLLVSILFLPVVASARWIFKLYGHDLSVQVLEVEYFQILGLGIIAALLNTTLACVYSGRGQTMAVLVINSCAMLFNFAADYALIFGHFGFPEMGIRGAAIATVLSSIVSVLGWVVLFNLDPGVRGFGLIRGCRFDRDLFGRILRFGLPNGLTMFLEAGLFNVFLWLIGQMGKAELAATNLAFTLNTLAFVPMIGFMTALETLVGRRIGEGKPHLAERTAWTAVRLSCYYMAVWVAIYLLFPTTILSVFSNEANPDEFEAMRQIAMGLLRFVAAYTLFDGLQLMFGGAIRGAGDTRFSLLFFISSEIVVMVIPVYIATTFFGGGIYSAWTWLTLWVVVLSVGFYWRFVAGHWKSMRVIEHSPPAEEPLPLEEQTAEPAMADLPR